MLDPSKKLIILMRLYTYYTFILLSKPLRSYIYIYMLAITGQTAELKPKNDISLYIYIFFLGGGLSLSTCHWTVAYLIVPFLHCSSFYLSSSYPFHFICSHHSHHFTCRHSTLAVSSIITVILLIVTLPLPFHLSSPYHCNFTYRHPTLAISSVVTIPL